MTLEEEEEERGSKKRRPARKLTGKVPSRHQTTRVKRERERRRKGKDAGWPFFSSTYQKTDFFQNVSGCHQ